MTLEDAMRVADIFEQDDIIAVPAKACRTLVAEVRRLQEENKELFFRIESLEK